MLHDIFNKDETDPVHEAKKLLLFIASQSPILSEFTGFEFHMTARDNHERAAQAGIYSTQFLHACKYIDDAVEFYGGREIELDEDGDLVLVPMSPEECRARLDQSRAEREAFIAEDPENRANLNGWRLERMMQEARGAQRQSESLTPVV